MSTANIQSEKLLEIIFENTHTLIAYLDKDMKFLRVNKAYAAADGNEPDHFVGKGHFDLFPNEENEIIFKRVVETGEPYYSYAKPFEYAHNPERGVTHWDWSLEPVIDQQGEVNSLILHLMDVTQRIDAEEELKNKENALIAINEHIPGIVYQFVVDTNGKRYLPYVSPTIEKYFGLSDEAVINDVEQWFARVHGDDLPLLEASILESMKNMAPWEWEGRFTNIKGDQIWLHGSSIPQKLQDGSTLWDGMFIDITKRKQVENALVDSELWMKSIFDSLDEAVLVVNPERKLLNVNSAAIQIFGYTYEEIENSSTELFHVDHEHYVEFGSRIKKAFSQGQSAHFEFEAKRKNGEVFPSEHTVSHITNSAGELIGIISVVRDISVRKQSEKEIINHRDNLESMVVERTRELKDAQDELVRKERLATLGQLTATVSHELRNPLGAMRPSLHMLKKKSDKNDERLQLAIERIDRNIDRCDNIIDELLDYTRITDLNLTSVRIDEWLESVINDQIVPVDIQVKTDFGLNDVKVDIDADRLRRAFINVFENACHSMMDDNHNLISKKRASVNISTRKRNTQLKIVIEDSGKGMSKEILDKIFEPLFSTKTFGVGLGMPTVKQIMQQHDGGIDVESEEDKGTKIILWIPLKVNEN